MVFYEFFNRIHTLEVFANEFESIALDAKL